LRIFALIVAIDKYKSCEIPTLLGCENDGRSISDFLTKTLHVPSSHILILVNEAASRHAIIASFKSHFIRNEEIRKGDAMIFFYAGHGSRVEAPPGWSADNNLMETICPHDERTKDGDQNDVHGIPDRTIDGLMRSLAFHKGDNIVCPLSLF
jgi:Caspase domain